MEGKVEFSELYSDKNVINFKSDKTGHIIVKGKLYGNKNLLIRELIFESIFNQPYLRDFFYELYSRYEKYIDLY